jgi:hypothetical protein
MSNWGIEDDTSLAGTNENTGPKALRDAYDAMKQQNQELQNGLAAVQKQLRDQSVVGTLSELGIPATAASEYKGEADPAKVREWATTMQSIFGGGSGVPNTPSVDSVPPGLDPATQQQLQQMQNAGQQGQPLGNYEAAAGRLNDATDINGLISAWSTIK